ncbi:MAG: pentapeptide repeat-containing protein [Nitrospira sp.]
MNRADVEALIAKAQEKRQRLSIALPKQVGIGSCPINLAEADLSNADLSGLDLRHCNLWRAKLVSAVLKGTLLDRANMVQTNLSDADVTSASMVETNLHKAIITNIIGLDLETVPDFEARKGVRDYVISIAKDKAKAASDWDATPIEKKFGKRTVVVSGTRFVIGKFLEGANLKDAVM